MEGRLMTNKSSLSTRTGLGVAGICLWFLVPEAAVAADAAQEIATAEQHAGYAAGSDQLEMVQTHLHHTINCLVGPNGEGFDPNALNPCKDLGNGAIPDSTNAATKETLEGALAKAREGLAATELTAAQQDASETAAMLTKAK
jgi:hypothetical protein